MVLTLGSVLGRLRGTSDGRLDEKKAPSQKKKEK
jgi:hypothetical protein